MGKRKETNRIIFHHSLSNDVSASVIRGWHMNERGWKDIGYHFVIRTSGRIESGRDLDLIGAHTKGRNHDSIGVCLTGDLSKTEPTQAQIDSSRALYYSECKKNGKVLDIEFHREDPNPCPGLLLDRKVFGRTLENTLVELPKKGAIEQPKKYSAKQTIKKGAIQSGKVTAEAALGASLILKLLTGLEFTAMEILGVSSAVGLLSGLVTSGLNWWKNRNK